MTGLTTAIVYDFDGTLAPGYMQNYSLIPSLGTEFPRFWSENKELAKLHDADEILSYMLSLLRKSEELKCPITLTSLREHGKSVKLFEGVQDWFGDVNDFAQKHGLNLEHYVISSGLQEMIEGCSIHDNFKKIYASRYLYENERAVWPAVAINYTTKTQFLFRINKGIETTWDNSAINQWQDPDKRPIPFDRMIFIGDGETDIPSMKMVRHQGGYAVAVFDPVGFATKQEQIHRLIAEDRCNYVAPADYRKGSQLSVTVYGILSRIAQRSDKLRPLTSQTT